MSVATIGNFASDIPLSNIDSRNLNRRIRWMARSGCAAAWAGLLRIWKPVMPEMSGPAGLSIAKPKFQSFAPVHRGEIRSPRPDELVMESSRWMAGFGGACAEIATHRDEFCRLLAKSQTYMAMRFLIYTLDYFISTQKPSRMFLSHFYIHENVQSSLNT